MEEVEKGERWKGMVEGDGFYKGIWGKRDDAEGAHLRSVGVVGGAKADPGCPTIRVVVISHVSRRGNFGVV